MNLTAIYWMDFMETFRNNVAEKLAAVSDSPKHFQTGADLTPGI